MPGVTALAAAAALTLAGVQPQLASDGRAIYLTFARSNVIHVVRSDDGGTTFGTPVALPDAGRLAVGSHRGPRIAATDTTLLVSAISGQRGGGADGDVRVYRSTDGGRTWSAPAIVNDVPAAAREGLHAMAATRSGLVVLAWLDLREKGTRLYAAISRDHGGTWSPDTLVYASPSGSICECCHPSIAIGEEGGIAIMFRNSIGGNRDMYAAVSTDGRTFAAARKLGTGTWPLNACPMDGGAIGLTAAGPVATWRRATSIYLSTPDVPERELGSGRDATLHVTGDQIDVAWSTDKGLMLWRSGRAMTIGEGRFPAILALPDRTIVAWEQSGQVRLQTVPR